jgi:hypothetical protein
VWGRVVQLVESAAADEGSTVVVAAAVDGNWSWKAKVDASHNRTVLPLPASTLPDTSTW